MELPLRPLFASIALPALLAGVCACSTAAAAGAASARSGSTPSTHTASSDAALLAFAKQIGVSCERQQGKLACIGGRPEVGDYYDVELHPGCGRSGLFGGITAPEGSDLRDRIAPIDRRTTARLAKGQLLCIEAIGRAGTHASYYFVRQVPAQAIAHCGTGACEGYGGRPVKRSENSQGSCTLAADAEPSNACAAGWIRGEDVARIDAN